MTPQISSITNGPRQSNFELLRIVAMFLVLVVHADYLSLGYVTPKELHTNLLPSVTRIFIESFSIVCVNVFVLISGWFGIRTTLKGFLNFIFQYLFAYCVVYAIMIVTGKEDISLWNIKHCLDLTGCNWFILSYSALYFLAPLLNAGIKALDKRRFQYLLISFFLFQSIWGYIGAVKWVSDGYSLFSFIGLYLLASYLRRYGIRFSKLGFPLYIISVVATSLYCIISLQSSGRLIGSTFPVYAYCNPLVIIGAAALLLWFSQLKIKHSKLINWIAKSSFMVYLIHTTPWLGKSYFCKYMRAIYDRYDSIECLAMMGATLIGIFFACVLVDQPRKWLWNLSLRLYRQFKINFSILQTEKDDTLPTPPHN